MRYSRLFGKTSKTAPRDATAVSHKYLLQAGFIRQLSTGRYTLLPLGFKVAKKIEDIIRQEVVKTGAQELIVPTLHPIELWQQANRDKKFGTALMRVTDRTGAEFTLGATAEVVMMDLVNQFNVSYKDLPLNIFQFSQKFRDEARPTGGLLRTKEFVMKDAYSFHQDEAALQDTYQKYWHAYETIASRLSLDVVVVESDNGALGGSVSHEFMVPADVGEDVVVKCDTCDYAVNLERAEFIKEVKNPNDKPAALKEVEAVRGKTMEDGVELHNLPLWQQIKDVLYVDDQGRFVLAIIRGDLLVNETKLRNLTQSNELRPATDQEIIDILHSYPGFISPVGIKDKADKSAKIIIVADDSLRTIANAYGGSNKRNLDLINVNIDRDYQADLEGDIAQAPQGAMCSHCQKGKLQFIKAIEFGNIFNLGYTYSKPMNGVFVNAKGEEQKLYMGSYGIGIGRAMATIVEKHHDDFGIIWPDSVAPYAVHLVGLDLHDPEIQKTAEGIYQQLVDSSIDVLYDDRLDITAGTKFADADLIGIPLRLVISQRSLKNGGIEIKRRGEKEAKIVSVQQIADNCR